MGAGRNNGGKGRLDVPMRPPAPRRISSNVSVASSDSGGNSGSGDGRRKVVGRGQHDQLFRLLVILVLIVANINVAFYERHHNPFVHTPNPENVETMHGDGRNMLHPLDKRRFTRALEGDEKKPKPAVVRTEADNVDALPARDGGISSGGDKAPVRRILEEAGVDVDADLERELPSWSSFTSQYGSEPIIHGLEKCEEYRATVPPERRFVGPAGMFNTGTNLMAKLLSNNCVITERAKKLGPRSTGMRMQVPWGKHNPPSFRGNHVAKVAGAGIPQNDILPVVMVKDPYHWAGSMCRHQYTAFWKHDKNRCSTDGPGLVSLDWKGKEQTHTVNLKFLREDPSTYRTFESLMDVWNQWYGWYEDVDFPRVIVRSEDLLLYPEPVLKTVCECAGGALKGKLDTYMEDSAKGGQAVHKNSNGLVNSVLRYGSTTKRLEGYSNLDREYAARTVSKGRMDFYGYSQPPLPSGGN